MSKINKKTPDVRYVVPKTYAIDEDIQSMLYPLNLLHKIFFCPKYQIRNNIILPNGYISKIVCLIVTVMYILLFLYRVYYVQPLKTKQLIFVLIGSYYDFIAVLIGLLLNYFVNLLDSRRNIDIVLKIQDLHRFLNEKVNFDRFVVLNWISIIIASFLYFIIIVVGRITLNQPNFEFICGFAFLRFDVNIIYITRFIKLLSIKMNLWINQAWDIRQMDQDLIDSYCKRMFQAYANILNIYDLLKASYQQLVSRFFITF